MCVYSLIIAHASLYVYTMLCTVEPLNNGHILWDQHFLKAQMKSNRLYDFLLYKAILSFIERLSSLSRLKHMY